MRKKIEKITGIYRITCVISGSVYIGATNNLYKRFKEYNLFKNNKNDKVSKLVGDSFLLYGIDNHEFKIMCEFDSNIPKKELETYEDALILLYVNRLGEDLVLNSECNGKDKWCSLRYKNNKSDIFKGNKINLGRNLTKEHKQKFSKKVNQYNMDGILIHTWDSIREAERMTNIARSSIINACKGKYKQAKGYIWKYKLD